MMNSTFWQKLPKPFFALAPMEAVTDVVFRHVIAQAGRPDIFFTEFVNTASYTSEEGNHSTYSRLVFTPDEQPIVAQIWGNNPEYFKITAQGLKQQGFAGIDINMGCPDKTVIRQGSGCSLINQSDLSTALITATKSAGLPVSVKTRLGQTSLDKWQQWLTHLFEQDLVNLTVHLRTCKEMSKVPAHHELITDIKNLRDQIAPQTLLTINGDVLDRIHGKQLANQYNIEGLMIGRGVLTNPYAFSKSAIPTKEELFKLLKLHLDLHDKYNTKLTPRRFEPLKKFFKIYINNFPGASELRSILMQAKSTDEVREIIKRYI
jgi:tRNA-dihydrouridine synthase